MKSIFLNALLFGGAGLGMAARSAPIYERAFTSPDISATMDRVLRGEFGDDMNGQLGQILQEMHRGITSTMTAFPVRENLEAEAKVIVPVETPLRNRLPRVPGAGLAAAWKVASSFGTGFGTQTTATEAGTSDTTIPVANSYGFYEGETILISGTTSRVITDIDRTTHILTLASAATWLNGATVVKTSYYQPGGGAATRAFFAETGSPLEKTTVYEDRSETYKLLGEKGSLTGLAMAAGANFQNQLAIEKRNRLHSVMLSEENALLNSDEDAILAPWGDGTNALGYNGILQEIRENAPADHVQTGVGALTIAHLNAQITRQYVRGGRGFYVVMNPQEVLSLDRLAEASGSILRILSRQEDAKIGRYIAGFLHPIAGPVDVLVSNFIGAGTIMFGCDRIADGSPAIEVDVLPQAQLPELAPNESIQGYVAQEIAPSGDSPQVFPFIVTVYSVPKVKTPNVLAISENVLAVA